MVTEVDIVSFDGLFHLPAKITLNILLQTNKTVSDGLGSSYKKRDDFTVDDLRTWYNDETLSELEFVAEISLREGQIGSGGGQNVQMFAVIAGGGFAFCSKGVKYYTSLSTK